MPLLKKCEKHAEDGIRFALAAHVYQAFPEIEHTFRGISPMIAAVLE